MAFTDPRLFGTYSASGEAEAATKVALGGEQIERARLVSGEIAAEQKALGAEYGSLEAGKQYQLQAEEEDRLMGLYENKFAKDPFAAVKMFNESGKYKKIREEFGEMPDPVGGVDYQSRTTHTKGKLQDEMSTDGGQTWFKYGDLYHSDAIKKAFMSSGSKSKQNYHSTYMKYNEAVDSLLVRDKGIPGQERRVSPKELSKTERKLYDDTVKGRDALDAEYFKQYGRHLVSPKTLDMSEHEIPPPGPALTVKKRGLGDVFRGRRTERDTNTSQEERKRVPAILGGGILPGGLGYRGS